MSKIINWEDLREGSKIYILNIEELQIETSEIIDISEPAEIEMNALQITYARLGIIESAVVFKGNNYSIRVNKNMSGMHYIFAAPHLPKERILDWIDAERTKAEMAVENFIKKANSMQVRIQKLKELKEQL